MSRQTRTVQRRKSCQLRVLHQLEGGLKMPALEELIRMLRSEKFGELTPDHIRTVGQYEPIEIDGERFFDKAFTTGKEVAGSLGFAQHLGRRPVLRDLMGLRATLLGS